MPNKTKNPPRATDKRVRSFAVELYPEWDNFEEILGNIVSMCEKYAYITHDKDFKEDGTQKKTHVHVFVRNKNGATVSAYSKRLGIEQRFLQPINDEKGFLRYLTHSDDPDKHQYNRDEIHSNFDLSYIYRTEKNEGECVLELLEFALTATKREVIQYAVRENLYDVLRRNWNIIMATKDEENHLRFRDIENKRYHSIHREEIGRLYDSEGREVIICKNGECYGEEI